MTNTNNFQSAESQTNTQNNEVINNSETMENKISMTETPQVGNSEQLGNGKSVVGNKETTDSAKLPKKKDYTPVYTNEEKQKLETITKVCEEEIARVIDDARYACVPYSNGHNCLIDLRKAFIEGKIQFVSPAVNRIHGGDQKKTGESMLTYSPQHILMVMTVKMAGAAGILPVRFANDKNGDPIPDDALIFMDGNGRIDFLLGVDPSDWPEIYAVFPSKDAAGYYNLNMSFDVINTQVSIWKTQDMVQKRIILDGTSTHPGFKFINALVKKGYKYQSACQLATLDTDRIKKNEVTNGEAKTIFLNHDSAIRVYDALKAKFDEEPLKTKAFTQQVSILWKRLQKNYKAEETTGHFVDFINQLGNDKVKAINTAKNIKGGASKDEQRKQLLEQSFLYYVGSKNLKID